MILFSKRRNGRRQNRKYTRGRNKRKSVRKMKGGSEAEDEPLIKYLKTTLAENWTLQAIKTHLDNGASIGANIGILGDVVPIYKYLAILNLGTADHSEIHKYIKTLPEYKPTYY